MLPVPKAVPPVEAANHETVPADAAAVRVTVPVPQLDPGTELVIVGIGLTVMVKVIAAPEHPLAVGVTTIVATTGVAPVLAAVNEAIFPVPLAGSPMLVALLVQAKVVPVTGATKLIAVVAVPLQ